MGCCFGAENKGADCPNGTEPRDYGSTEKQALVITDQPQPVDGATEGSAYAYEEHESSSDSEDEDLKRFNQARNSRRSNSVRSAGIDKGVIATEHEEVKQYDNQAYQLDTPSNIGSTEEHLFDVSDLTHDPDAQLISKCGQLEVTFNYQQENCKMHITVNHAKDIPSKDRGGANSTQIRLLLLPTKKQRHKTKIKTGEHPVFEETFTFKVPPDAVGEMGIRMRLYGCERMRRERMIGESVVGFASLNLEQATTHLLTLEPRANISSDLASSVGSLSTISHGDSKLDVSSLSRSDSASSSQSMQHGGMPELLVGFQYISEEEEGLAYNGTTGRLSVEVIKGSNFRNMAMQRAPDTYVKLTLMSANGQEIARSKTSIRRGQPNPLYKETFMFQVALFQLPDVTLMVSVYNKRSMKRKEMIGWFSSGLNSSGEEELSHWKDMVDSKGEQVCRWHVLLEA